jgi:hypothetical protein
MDIKKGGTSLIAVAQEMEIRTKIPRYIIEVISTNRK